ncbi:serine acetyltransferase [Methanosarcina sp. 1.H.A.2.2]|uniref:serine acetyltransferase n=1 Tax=Methanosarcina sp. 1.H.A.2.2 TaxID=1483601 RepID=UPI0006219171|nr:serine acetyltransferase [Methanosarcina sp. 1.H.A.2.2]KKH47206.1 hypothetical protein EO93_06195 [Methanosarcina sp. 1.H.A.2.2]
MTMNIKFSAKPKESLKILINMQSEFKNSVLVSFLLSIRKILYKFRNTKIRFLYQMLHFLYLFVVQLIFSGYLPATVKFGENVFFPHGLNGIFISGSAEIGEGSIIYQQVTIGSTFLDGGGCLGAPVIGKNCILGAGCKVIGNIRIGDNVKIATNVSVNKDVPANYTVVPSKPRYLKREIEE